MRRGAILREAWRDIVSGTTRVGAFALVFGVLVTGLAAADQLTVRRIVDEAARYQSSGASVITIAAEGRVRGDACEALDALPGVRAAGALRQEPDGLRLATLPQSPVTLYTVTPHLSDVLRSSSDGNGIVLSADAVSASGRRVGDSIVTAAGTSRVAGVYPYPADGRRIGFGYAALDVSSSATLFDECWVDAWPPDEHLEALLLTAVQPSAAGDADVQLSRLNTTLGTTFDGVASFEERLTAHGWLVAIVAGLAIGFVSIRIRRVALASALHTRVPRTSLAAIVALETGAWVGPVVVVALAATAVLAATGDPSDRGTTLLLSARVVVPGAAAAFSGSTIALAVTRERHLFRYVKDR
ncbi:hypothetical protein [Labedella endophytica]|uniref:ABC transporter permease n=1 Tax=Labedella endophytica TaxID=1523160 RepID=A0A433JRW9_9MICO|nr:hypothetical protein [Labedella endophytica]RUR01108.1 hypothetical protein ELQ94_06160 [Labedella endophytica]